MEAEEDTVPPPYGLEDVAPHAESAFSLCMPDLSLDSEYSHGLYLGRAPQLRPGLFVGRDAELKSLSHFLLPGSLTRSVVAIAAVGGLGKTQLAITYAERYHRNYSSVFWLDAKDESTLKQELAGLADVILNPAQTSTTTSADEDNNTIKQIKYWFSLPHNNRWLLILDNYDDPKLPGLNSATGYDIRSYFPSRNQGSILITTRSKKLNFAKCLELGKLENTAQGLKILSIRSDQDLSYDPHAEALATRLAGFPLALATAGAYLGQSSGGCSAHEYLTLYDQQWDELEENADVLLEYEDRTLFSTWNLSLEQVRQQNSNAAMLLRFLAFFGNSGITFKLFRTTRDRSDAYRLDWLNNLTESKIIFNKAMAILQNYSLIEYIPQGYFLHTCLHDWTLHALNKTVELDYFWDAMLCIATNVQGNLQRDYWHNNQRLLQHATRLWQIRLKNAFTMDISHGMQAYCLQWIGYLWSQQGNPVRAEALLSSALNACEMLYGSRDTRTLEVIVCLADTYKIMDRYVEAEDMYRRALRACESVSTLDKSVPSRVRHNLALMYQRQGKLAEAEQMLREALDGFEVSLGSERYQAPLTANVLAAVLLRQRRFLEAEALSEKAIEGLTKALSSEHPLTLTAMATRGEVHFNQEQWEQAEALYSTVLEGKERVFGSEHKETRQAARYLGEIYAKRQKLDKLVKLTQRWESKESILYNYLALLGRTLLKAQKDQQASIAFQRSLHVVNGAECWQAFCDGCAQPKILLTPSIRRFVCRQCEDTDLCGECYEMHQAGTKILESCVGHSFFQVPALTSDQAASPPEQP